MLSAKYVRPGIIAANVSVFLAWKVADSDTKLRRSMYSHFTLSSDGVVRKGKVYTMITSVFSHKDVFHLASNMITFHFFSQSVHYLLGTNKFLFLYVGSGLFSSLTYVLWPYFIPSYFPSKTYRNTSQPALGASGAVNAIVMFSILQAPRQIVYVNLLLPVPAALFGALYVLQDAWGLYQGGGNVANAAHLGGAAFGSAYFFLRRVRRR